MQFYLILTFYFKAFIPGNSFPSRYSDPGFRYYRQGGIKIEANLRNVPIYIDGKYVGDTPLTRPIEVEPGWHQVSGFSPVYTHLASQKGLQFVGYDSIANTGFQTVVIAQTPDDALDVASNSHVWEQLDFTVSDFQVFPQDPL